MMNIRILRLCAALILHFVAVLTFGQQNLDSLLEEYSDYNTLNISNHENLFISMIGDSLSITSNIKKEYLYTGQQQLFSSKESIYQSSFSTIENIMAGSIERAEDYNDTTFVNSISESSEMQSYVFYNESKSHNFTFPKISHGTISFVEYTKRISNPFFINSFYFGDYFPTLSSIYTVTYSADVEVGYMLYNTDNLTLEVLESINDKGEKILQFKSQNLPQIRLEDKSPRYQHVAPHIQLYIKSYNDGKEKILPDLDALHLLYRSFLSKVDKTDSNKLTDLVLNIVKDEDSEIEKVEKVFNWVQKNIKYIAFEDGMRGFVPHSGDYVCDKRYGDCKDMATIIIDMLATQNIKAYHTWVGSRDLPYSYHETWTPIVDNHMIATYFDKDRAYFLDATGQYTPFGFPTSMIQGKEALVSLDEDVYKILEVPQVESARNRQIDTYNFDLRDEEIIGSGLLTYSGLLRSLHVYGLSVSQQSKVEAKLNKLLNRGSNKMLVEDYAISNLDKYHLPLEVEYSFHIKDYAKVISNSIYLNLNMHRALSDIRIDTTRKLDYLFDDLFEHQISSTFRIPSGYSISKLPGKFSDSNDLFTYNIEYALPDSQTLEYSFNYSLLVLEVPKEKFDEWNEIMTGLRRAMKKTIILKKN